MAPRSSPQGQLKSLVAHGHFPRCEAPRRFMPENTDHFSLYSFRTPLGLPMYRAQLPAHSEISCSSITMI